MFTSTNLPEALLTQPGLSPLSFFCIELTVCRCVCTCVYMCGDVHAKALKWRSEDNLQKPALSLYFVVLGARTQINRQRAPLPSDKSPSIIINIQFNPITIPFFFFLMFLSYDTSHQRFPSLHSSQFPPPLTFSPRSTSSVSLQKRPRDINLTRHNKLQ